MHTVVGRPIDCPLTAEPTVALVDEYHKRYVAELQRVFETHKARLGYGSSELEIY